MTTPAALEALRPQVFLALIVVVPVVALAILRTFDPMKRGRKALVFVCRVAIAVAIVVALADVRWWREKPETRLCVLALLDVSSSVPETALESAQSQLERLYAHTDEKHSVGLLVFAGQPQVVFAPAAPVPDAARLHKAITAARASTELDPGTTDVARAIDLALSVFPADSGKRIVIFSDGGANSGDTNARILACRERKIDVETVALSHEKAPFDLAVVAVAAPTNATAGQGFEVKVSLSARAAAPAKLALYRNGYLLEQRTLDLKAGARTEIFRQQLEAPGLYLYRAQLSCAQAQQSIENDTAYAFTALRNRQKVLVLGEDELQSRHVLNALQRARMECEFRTPDGAPDKLTDLLDFDVVVLNSIPSKLLPVEKQALLRDYVDVFGGGLFSIGLDTVGGYANSPVEAALPVSCDLSGLSDISKSVVIVADTSRSIVIADAEQSTGKREDVAVPAGDNSAELDRPAIIKNTAKQILKRMSERDYFGLINFGTETISPSWIVRPQKVYDRQKIEQSIEDGLQTAPSIPDPQSLFELVQKEADPAAPLAAEALAPAVLKLLNPNRRPHVDPGPLMEFLRNKLKARNKQLNPTVIAQEVERLVRPNAFLARSNVYRSIVRAARELEQRETAIKRIVILSDGYFDGNYDYAQIAGQLAADGITLSTVALKDTDAHLVMLEEISKWGLGLAYRATKGGLLDEQMRAEFQASAKPRVMEFPFRARKLADSPLLRGVDVGLAPPLFGYVRTQPKLGAEVLLGAPPDYEPLLAAWTYGAGRAAVFTSDAHDRWSELWSRDWSASFNQLLASSVDSLHPRLAAHRITPQLDVHGRDIALTADMTDVKYTFINGEAMKARFYFLGESGYVFSRTAMHETPMVQVAPGRYSCEHHAPAKGLYVVRIAGTQADDVATCAAVISSSAEETMLSANEAELKAWAAAGGGRFGATPEQWTDMSGKTRLECADVSRWAAALATVLFALDVLLRRWPGLVLFLRQATGRGSKP